jgi:hypothetical protein
MPAAVIAAAGIVVALRRADGAAAGAALEQPWSIRRHKSPIKIYLILVSLAVTRPHRHDRTPMANCRQFSIFAAVAMPRAISSI